VRARKSGSAFGSTAAEEVARVDLLRDYHQRERCGDLPSLQYEDVDESKRGN